MNTPINNTFKKPKDWLGFLDCWMTFKDDPWVDKDPIAAFNELRESYYVEEKYDFNR